MNSILRIHFTKKMHRIGHTCTARKSRCQLQFQYPCLMFRSYFTKDGFQYFPAVLGTPNNMIFARIDNIAIALVGDPAIIRTHVLYYTAIRQIVKCLFGASHRRLTSPCLVYWTQVELYQSSVKERTLILGGTEWLPHAWGALLPLPSDCHPPVQETLLGMLGLANMPGPLSLASVGQVYRADRLWTWTTKPLTNLPIVSVFRSI